MSENESSLPEMQANWEYLVNDIVTTEKIAFAGTVNICKMTTYTPLETDDFTVFGPYYRTQTGYAAFAK